MPSRDIANGAGPQVSAAPAAVCRKAHRYRRSSLSGKPVGAEVAAAVLHVAWRTKHPQLIGAEGVSSFAGSYLGVGSGQWKTPPRPPLS